MKRKIFTVLPAAINVRLAKSFLLTIVVILATMQVNAQKKYTITGNIAGLTEPMKVMLRYAPSKNVVINDSAVVKDGKFRFEGTIARPYKISLTLRPFNPPPVGKAVVGQVMKGYDFRNFYLVAGHTIITGGSLATAKIENPMEAQYQELLETLQPSMKEIGQNNLAIYNSRNADSIEVLKQKRSVLRKKLNDAYTTFISKYPDSYISLDIVQNGSVVIEDSDGFEQMFNALSSNFKNSEVGKAIFRSLQLEKAFAIGKPIMNFTQNDVNGKPVSLSSLKGKYVLIDFWASWCGPCRMEYPFLHKAYDQFKDKNFEIIGVSLDNKKELWVNSIKENNFDWLEVSDLKGRQNEVALAYGVTAIPQSFLVDPNGTIIAKNLRGEDLIETLKKVITPNHK